MPTPLLALALLFGADVVLTPIVLGGDERLHGDCLQAAREHLTPKLPKKVDDSHTFRASEFTKALFDAPGCVDLDSTRKYKVLVPADGKATASYEPFDLSTLELEYQYRVSECSGSEHTYFVLRLGTSNLVVGHTKHPASVPYSSLEGTAPPEPTLAELKKTKKKTTTQTFVAPPGLAKIEVRQTYVPYDGGETGGEARVVVERVDLLAWLPGEKAPVVLHREDSWKNDYDYFSASVSGLLVTDLEGDSQPEVLFRTGRNGRALVRISGATARLEWLVAPDALPEDC